MERKATILNTGLCALMVRSDIPVILSSGHNPSVDEKSAEETGFSACILKPFTRAELAASVLNAFKKNREKN